MTAPAENTTGLLQAVSHGDPGAAARLAPYVYDQLRQLASLYLSREPGGHTLQATALVHEAFLKLVDQSRVDWQGKTHFLAVGAQAMRRILVDHARGKQREKRGGGRRRVDLDQPLTVSPQSSEDVLELHEALEELAGRHPRCARMVEMRFFGGMTVEETAAVLGVTDRTVRNDWRFARAWLRRRLSDEPSGGTAP